MRITDLKIDGFGVWSGLELPDLSDELNVFYGPNEAGKTTLMQFVRSVLYGFSPQRRGRYLPPVRPGRPGGMLAIHSGQKQYLVSRYADEPGEAALVSDGLETHRDEQALTPLLGEVDEPTFNNVFAFGLREIQELSALSDTQAADELYNLALGLDRVSLLDVMRDLETTRKRLLAPDERPSLVTQLLSQRSRLRAEIDELGQGTARYVTLSAERDKLAGEISRLQAEVARFEQQGRELALARGLAERWQRRTAIDEQLGAHGHCDNLPEQALARFERLESRLATRRRRFDKLRLQRLAIDEEIDGLNINEALCRLALRFEALGEQQQWIASLDGQVTDLEAELLELESERAETVEQFGISPETIAAAEAGPSKRTWKELGELAKKLRAAQHQLTASKQSIAAAEETAAVHEQQVAAALVENKPGGLTQALAEAGELVSQLRRRVQIDERLDQMSRRQTELEDQSHDHLEKQILPTWVIVGMGGLFVLGCSLVLLYLAGLVLPASFSRVLGWPMGLIGVAAAAVASGTKVWMEYSAGRQFDNCHTQLRLLGQQIEQAKQERDALDEKLPRGGGPLVARMQTAEKALARLEELMPLEAQRETAERERGTLANEAAATRAKFHELKRRWRQLLTDNGLPGGLKPRQLHQYARRRSELGELTRKIDQRREDLARRRAERQALCDRITQLVADANLTPQATRPLEQLRECLAELGPQQSRLKRRDELLRQTASVRRRQTKIKRQAQKLRARREQLLLSGGTTDAVEFRRLAGRQAEAARLRAERDQLAGDIARSVAGQVSEDQLAEWMAAPQDLEQLESHVADARRIAASHASQALERRGEMNQQLAALLDDRRLAHKHIELDIVQQRLRDALDRWRTVTTCGMMLEAVRQYYEREHQPPALREASGYLERLTGGRYRRVWTPLGEHLLVVDDGEGNSLQVELLSRGTREQLFLALRLALVSSYAQRGVTLPLVLDDVLVNFDAPRAKAAAMVLRDFARAGHQLMIFTCHEHIAKMFKQLKAEVRALPDNGNATPAAPRPARRPRRVRREAPVEPEPEPEAVETEVAEIEPQIPDAPVPEPMHAPSPPRITPPTKRRIERVQWSAEEFEGELADRVRRTSSSEPETDSPSEAADSDDEEDAEAA